MSLERDDAAELLYDVSNSQALQDLEEDVRAGSLTEEAAAAHRAHFERLHGALLGALSNEKSLLEHAKGLKQQLQAEEAQLELLLHAGNGGDGSDSATTRALREDVEAARAEVALCQEHEQMRALEVAELQRQRNELRARCAEVEAAHAAALAPQLETLRSQCSALQAELQANTQRLAETRSDADALRSRLEQLELDKQQLAEAKADQAAAAERACVAPDKARRAADLLVNAVKGLVGQQEMLAGRVQQEEARWASLVAQVAALEEEHVQRGATLEKGRAACEAKARAEDDIRKDLDIARLEADNLLAERVNLDMEASVRANEAKREGEALSRQQLERDKALRRLRRAEVALNAAQEQVPPLEAARCAATAELAAVQKEARRGAAAHAELKKDVDQLIHAFLQQENAGEKGNELFKAAYAETVALEGEIGALRAEENERMYMARDLAAQRDRMGRVAADKTARAKEAFAVIALKQLIIQDLKRQRKETQGRVRDFQQLYDLVKNQRNKFVNLVQVAGQSCAEVKDKLKMLTNELTVLRGEEAAKTALLARARTDHTLAQSDRDSLRQELNRLTLQFRKRQDAVDEQIAEIDKLNAVVNGAERDMLRLRRQYESAVEARNYTGIMLIDRNDELCILYEKANVQEEVLRNGQTTLQRRDDELRMLRIEVAEVTRAIGATRKLLPHVPAADAQIALAKKQLLEMRSIAAQLSEQLESPENKSRWRRLGGKIPDKEELTAKIGQLEQCLAGKREVLMEKDLILEELTSLSARLRQQAAEGRQDTLDLAHQVNLYQSRIRAVTRKMMATVSELSLYQASSLKLNGEKTELEETLAAAQLHLEAGEAPTVECEREWGRLERESVQLAACHAEAHSARIVLDPLTAPLFTTAEQRPNAYIPEQLGIPKPYGCFAPFKPSDQGSTMRHTRKPEPVMVVV